VTNAPAIGFPSWSRTITRGATATAVFTVADWLLPASIVMLPAPPAEADAVKVTEPGTPAAVAWSVLLSTPALGPSAQDVTVADPSASVCTDAGAAGTAVPPPLITWNATAVPTR
jgi:hypothetical protein